MDTIKVPKEIVKYVTEAIRTLSEFNCDMTLFHTCILLYISIFFYYFRDVFVTRFPVFLNIFFPLFIKLLVFIL